MTGFANRLASLQRHTSPVGCRSVQSSPRQYVGV